MRSQFSSSLQGFFPKHVCIDGTLAENRCGLQRNDCWEYIIYVHDVCTELLCDVACMVIWRFGVRHISTDKATVRVTFRFKTLP